MDFEVGNRYRVTVLPHGRIPLMPIHQDDILTEDMDGVIPKEFEHLISNIQTVVAGNEPVHLEGRVVEMRRSRVGAQVMWLRFQADAVEGGQVPAPCWISSLVFFRPDINVELLFP